ncbi:MAG TPA: DNA repair protein RadA, partial [Streptosporangiaceae bacterium]|nr:DNA repair protein RadA [Streptosporangiaceae bacterium]
VVAIGEVGLAGEIRRVTGVQRRLAEAQRLGFRRAIVPPGSGFPPAGGSPREAGSGGAALADVREARDVRTAIAMALGG